MHRRATLQVRQRKVRLAVAAVGGAEQREQRRVLREGQELAVAPRPPLGREIEREDADLGNKGIGHGVLLGRAREDAEQRDDEVDTKVRLKVRMRLAAARRCDGLWTTVRIRGGYKVELAKQAGCRQVILDVGRIRRV